MGICVRRVSHPVSPSAPRRLWNRAATRHGAAHRVLAVATPGETAPSAGEATEEIAMSSLSALRTACA